jgi:FKBP-type peptidyl-prolyl cis-trans isomerase FklB
MTRSSGFVIAFYLLFVPFLAADEKKGKTPAAGQINTAQFNTAQLNTTVEQASYAIGLNIGRNLKRDGVEVNTAAIVQGLLDAISNAKPKLTDAQCQAALEAFDQQMRQVMLAKDKAEGEKNKREGQIYLEANQQKQGVVKLPSGLQYLVLKSGNGPKPTANDVVRTHYHGTLISGKVFDSSVERGEPAVFPVGGVIRGWTEALQLMKVGDKWRLFVPSELAYGPDRRSADIGPNSVLVFEVELLGIEAKK